MKLNTIIHIKNPAEDREDTYLLTVEDDGKAICPADYIEYRLNKEIKTGHAQTMTDICNIFTRMFGNTYSLQSMNKHIAHVSF